MAYDKQKVIDIALAEVNYLEKASNAQLDDPTANAGKKNYTKYARDLDRIGFFNSKKNGYAWCAVWVCWDFVQAYGVEGAKELLCLPPNAANNYAAGCRYADMHGITSKTRDGCSTALNPAIRFSFTARIRKAFPTLALSTR